MTQALLSVLDLATHLGDRQDPVRAVDGVSFSLQRGETLAVVGESGSGKSMLCRTILGLLPRRAEFLDGGRIMFAGQALAEVTTGFTQSLKTLRLRI